MKATRYSLRKTEILRGYQAFSRTISSGRTLQKGLIRCFYMENPGNSRLRVGFSVTRNVRTAGARNKLRRWMRESYRLRKDPPSDLPGQLAGKVDVVFLLSVRSSILLNDQSRNSIDQAISYLLEKLKLQFPKKP